MIDIHSHVLPMMDDGAYDYDESMQMAEMAARSGVKVLVATPHSNQEGRFENYYDKSMEAAFRALKDAMKEERILIELCLGMEIMSSDRVVELLNEGKLIGLNKGRHCLVEFGFDEFPEVIETQLSLILSSGYIPVIAHPERYECIQDEPLLMRRWMKNGCKTQVNKGSVLGRFGRQIEDLAWMFLENRLVSCIGSDAHKPYFRTTDMSEIYRCITRYFSSDYAYELLEKNPAKMIGRSKNMGF